VIDADRSGTRASDIVVLVYELLDAHVDTIKLAGEVGQAANGDPHAQDWAAHLDYLRDLQRVGREALAHL
jgi:hypothetical protein